jgi:hypothetical protein
MSYHAVLKLNLSSFRNICTVDDENLAMVAIEEASFYAKISRDPEICYAQLGQSEAEFQTMLSGLETLPNCCHKSVIGERSGNTYKTNQKCSVHADCDSGVCGTTTDSENADSTCFPDSKPSFTKRCQPASVENAPEQLAKCIDNRFLASGNPRASALFKQRVTGEFAPTMTKMKTKLTELAAEHNCWGPEG